MIKDNTSSGVNTIRALKAQENPEQENKGQESMKLFNREITKESVIIFISKVVSFFINAFLILLGIGIVAGGIWMLVAAIHS